MGWVVVCGQNAIRKDKSQSAKRFLGPFSLRPTITVSNLAFEIGWISGSHAPKKLSAKVKSMINHTSFTVDGKGYINLT